MFKILIVGIKFSVTLKGINVMSEEWLTITDVSKKLNLKYAKLSRLVQLKKVKTKKNPHDERVTLIEVGEIKRYFELP